MRPGEKDTFGHPGHKISLFFRAFVSEREKHAEQSGHFSSKQETEPPYPRRFSLKRIRQEDSYAFPLQFDLVERHPDHQNELIRHDDVLKICEMVF